MSVSVIMAEPMEEIDLANERERERELAVGEGELHWSENCD